MIQFLVKTKIFLMNPHGRSYNVKVVVTLYFIILYSRIFHCNLRPRSFVHIIYVYMYTYFSRRKFNLILTLSFLKTKKTKLYSINKKKINTQKYFPGGKPRLGSYSLVC